MGNSGIEVPITKKLYQILCRIGHRRILLRLASQDLHVHWPFKSDTSGKVSNLELLFSSRSLRMKIINLDLVSMPEIGGDCFLGLVLKPEIECQKFSVSSRCARLNQKNSHPRLEIEKMTLADLCLLV